MMVRPLAAPFAFAAKTALATVLLSAATGCGALQAIGNPKVMWAIQDPATMTVVVRRADIADGTVQEVNRLLTATPANADSDWLKHVGPETKDAAQQLKVASGQTMYTESHARVVAAEVWVRTLHQLKGGHADHVSLLAAISPDLSDAYLSILGKKVEIAGIGALIDVEKAALQAKDISAEDRALHQTTITKLEKMKSESEADVDPLAKAFLATAGTAAAKLPADQKTKLTPAIANLLQALADADMANSAAAVRYPLALRSMLTSVKAVVPQIVADIVEEKTGHRPDMNKLKPDVSLSGTDVSITLAGLTPADLGALKIDDVTKEAVVRSGKWVFHATTLLMTVSTTKEAISFQTDVLTQILTNIAPGANVQALAVQIPAGTAAGAPAGAATSGPSLPFGGGKSVASLPSTPTLPGAPTAAKVPSGVTVKPAAHKDSPATTTKVKAPGVAAAEHASK